MLEKPHLWPVDDLSFAVDKYGYLDELDHAAEVIADPEVVFEIRRCSRLLREFVSTCDRFEWELSDQALTLYRHVPDYLYHFGYQGLSWLIRGILEEVTPSSSEEERAKDQLHRFARGTPG